MNILLKVRIILIVNFIILSVYSSAQDIHFSQLHSVPQLLNPATTGIMEPGMRLSNTYRNQWKQLDFPFVTNYLSAEGKIKFLGQTLGLGGYFIHDHSSNLFLTSDQVYLSLSYSKFFRNNQFVIALQPGWVLKSLDSRLISFGNQWDPNQESYNPSLPSGEILLEDEMNYFDMNVGIFWRAKMGRLFPSAGVAIHHINQPVESFYTNNDSIVLPMKYSLHASIDIPAGNHYQLSPMVLYSTTSGASEFLGGLKASYQLMNPDFAVKKLYGIAAFRMDPFRTIDALIFGVGMTYHNFDLCVSYDFTVSSLSRASRFQRAFEVSLIYNVIRTNPKSKPEPCFML